MNQDHPNRQAGADCRFARRVSSLQTFTSELYYSGKSVYFWALVSALGTFWLGAGVSMRHSIEELVNPTVALDKVQARDVYVCHGAPLV